MNDSPWVEELNANRASETLTTDIHTDVAIVGAGIAGMATAYFILTRTQKRVVVLERALMAHGASGHNAGMVVAAFERAPRDLATEFNPGVVARAQQEVESGWDLLAEMVAAADKDMSYHRSMGYGGLRTNEEVLSKLKDNEWKRAQNISFNVLLIAEEANIVQELAGYEGLYETKPHQQILELLETSHPEYIAAEPEEFGVINSALLCEKLLIHLLATYSDRFALYEHTPVSKVLLHSGDALIDAGTHTIEAARVVLCTNGFEDILLVNKNGLDIDTKFHHTVSGKIGFMSAYVDDSSEEPGARWYTMEPDALSMNPNEEGFKGIDAFLYTSRRPRVKGGTLHTIGGPDLQLKDRMTYDHKMEYPQSVMSRIGAAIKKLRNIVLDTKDGLYTWHGLMGYTPSGVRLVGAEPKNPILMYNLGCNGIGILPSIAGGLRIAKLVRGDVLPPSLFDPK